MKRIRFDSIAVTLIILAVLISGLTGFYAGTEMRPDVGDVVKAGETISVEEAIRSSEIAAKEHLDAAEKDSEWREFHLYWASLHSACADYLGDN